MSRAGVPRIVGSLVVVASSAFLMSCAKAVQQTGDQALIEALAPDAAKVYVNFSCGAVNSIGLFDAPVGGNPAWAFMRHPNGPKNQISWEVAQNAQLVTINSIGNKSGEEVFPIDKDPNEQGGSPRKAYKAKVKSNAGNPGNPAPGDPPLDKTYYYAIDVTCKPASGPDVRLVIDPEMIVRKP